MSSRREYPSLQPGHTVAIGWDNPMQCYFAEVVREQDDDDERNPVVLRRHVARPEAMAAALTPWLALTPDLIAQLKADRVADLDRGPTKLQRSNLSALDALLRSGR